VVVGDADRCVQSDAGCFSMRGEHRLAASEEPNVDCVGRVRVRVRVALGRGGESPAIGVLWRILGNLLPYVEFIVASRRSITRYIASRGGPSFLTAGFAL
jgi:hypothetical protein